ncbi:MAG: YkgJ family cysteine cluster protein [Dehalococcoidia bacterium]|nr:MAG: YkgJ family cysteine cluster protein [Dehalococcoidia bacterium]
MRECCHSKRLKSCTLELTSQIIAMPDNRKLSVSPLVCFRCGVCCVKYQAILTLNEAQGIANYLEISLDIFINKYIDHSWPGTDALLISQRDGGCVFLEQDKINNNATACLIQRVKPSICRQWNAGVYRKECQDGLFKYWKIRVSHTGLLEGDEERLRDFHSFVASLS